MRTIRAVFESMPQCVSETGIPLKVLKLAKASGCPAFKTHRVHLKELLEWLFSRDAEEQDVASWGEELRKHQARRQKVLADKAEGTVIGVEEVGGMIVRCATGVKSEIGRLLNEGPVQLAGLPVAEVRGGLRKHTDAMLNEIQRLENEFKPASETS